MGLSSLKVNGQTAPKQTFSHYLKEVMRKDSIPGLAVGIIQKGGAVHFNYLGYANLEDATQVNPGSVFQIASVSKQFTAVSILLLAREKKLKLEDPIVKYIPGAPLSWSAITIKHLLSHSSGLMNYEDLPGFEKQAFLDSNHAAVLRTILPPLFQQPLLFPPGQQSQYCNTNYFLLGVIVESVTRESYESFIQRNLLNPLGLSHTTVNQINQILPGRVAGYSLNSGKRINADRIGMNWFFAEGNLVSTVKDLSYWLRAFFTNVLLNPQESKLMFQPVALSSGVQGKFGLGWFVDASHPGWIYHSGHTPGFASFVCLDNQSKKGLVLLMNTDHLDTEKLKDLARKLLAFYP